MKLTLAIIVALNLSGYAHSVFAVESNSPIDRLALRLANDHFWKNGTYPVIILPETATSHEVVGQCFKMTTFDNTRVTTFTIREEKEVTVPGSLPDKYKAVLVDSDLGSKIVLLQYLPSSTRWWVKIYDADNL